MYWPSVQDDWTRTPVTGDVASLVQRLFSRPAYPEMKGLQSESSSESFTKPLTARMQPITDTLSRGLQTSIVIFDQSRLTSAVSRAFNMHRKHDQPDCSR
ncbi:hypothetical protein V1264_011594 [Littorina saxatilis]|uniref:Uncharacterized protein n=1 Tax=Littorina saxatilis TaxID=31220 RepID=A0AAN9GMI6_9CAEN